MATTDSVSVFAEGTFEEQVPRFCSHIPGTYKLKPQFIDPRTRELCGPKSIRRRPCSLHQTLSGYFEDRGRTKTIRRRCRSPEKDFLDGFKRGERAGRWF